jgi:predicted nucleic acid-binding protein
MPFVLDASVTISWAFPDEQHPVAARAEALLQTAGELALVPSLWWYEVRNALLVSERRGRTTPDRTAVFLDNLSNLQIQVAPGAESNALLDLARSHGLSVYDAAYLSLAVRERLPLATLDRALVNAAAALRIPVLN